MFTYICGWIGSILLALCGLPQLIKTLKTRRVNDFSGLFLLMWFLGEVLTLIYILSQPFFQLPLLANYCINIIITATLINYKFKK